MRIETTQLKVQDGEVSASTFGIGDAGDLIIRASDLVEVRGRDGGLFADAYSGASGDGGNLTVETGRLSVSDGADVLVSTSGSGNAGNLLVQARDSVEVVGADSYLSANVNTEASGTGGDVTVETGRLSVRDGAQIQAGTFGSGSSGTLVVRARDSVELSGTSADDAPSGLFTTAEPGSTGGGGNLTVETERLSVSDGAAVAASTFGIGDAGALTIRASDLVEVRGEDSGLFAVVTSGASGNGGNLTVETGRLNVTNGAVVSASTSGRGDAGDLTVRTSDTVEVSGKDSLLITNVGPGAQGAGGNLTVETGRLSVSDGEVSASTFGIGDAGALIIRASDSVEVRGEGSGLFTDVTPEASGNGGDLRITTEQLNVRDGTQVTVSNEGSGNAGALRVEAGEILLDIQGKLRASTASGSGGNIDLQVQDEILMRRNSLISAEAGGTGNGGNIIINAPLIVAFPSENSDIIANASQGQGGNINITTQGIFGLEERNPLTQESDINAKSEFGVNGTVQINRLDVDPSQGLVNLPAELVDASNSIAQDCPASVSSGESKFIITGRGGLPPNPNDPLTGDNVLTDWNTLDSDTENRSSAAPSTNSAKESAPTTIVEANGWMVNNKGEVILTASVPTATLDIPWVPKSNCNVSAPES